MNQFKILSLPELTPQYPDRLIELMRLVCDCYGYPYLYQLQGGEIIQPRSLDEVIEDIESGHTERIQPIEWAYCIHTKANWDRDNPERSQATSDRIWQLAESNPWLKQILLWQIVIYDNQSNIEDIAPSLIESFLKIAKSPKSKNQDDIKIAEAIITKNYYLLSKFTCDRRLTPRSCLAQFKLPTNNQVVDRILDVVVDLVIQRGTHIQSKQLEWLLACFQEMSVQQQIQQVDKLLTAGSKEMGSRSSKLVEWLRLNYGPRTANSHWHQLSDRGKSALRRWIGAASWGDFQRLINALLQQLNQDDFQFNQLKRRKGFWSNYSDRFERIRILLPKETVKIISRQLKRDIDILVPDGSDPTEICILDFGDIFIVEFFRGSGSEIRLFHRDRYPAIEQQLFEAQNLSVKQLRRLGGEVHDHVYLWQVYAERWLREHEIYPNQGTVQFKGLHPSHAQYDNGLPTPSLDRQRSRQQSLERWRNKIAQLDREAKE